MRAGWPRRRAGSPSPPAVDLEIRWRACDLRRRVGLDTRRSIVLYYAQFRFNYALDELPSERTLRKLYQETPVRYWSKGV